MELLPLTPETVEVAATVYAAWLPRISYYFPLDTPALTHTLFAQPEVHPATFEVAPEASMVALDGARPVGWLQAGYVSDTPAIPAGETDALIRGLMIADGRLDVGHALLARALDILARRPVRAWRAFEHFSGYTFATGIGQAPHRMTDVIDVLTHAGFQREGTNFVYATEALTPRAAGRRLATIEIQVQPRGWSEPRANVQWDRFDFLEHGQQVASSIIVPVKRLTQNEHEHTLFIKGISVEPAHQRRGIGHLIMTTLWDHYIGLAYDTNASGPSTASSANPTGLVVDVTDRDDVNTLSLAVLRYQTPVVVRARLDADRVVVNYGAYVTWRRQDEELPSYYRLGIEGEDRHYQESEFVTRGVDFIGGDLWFRLNVQRLRVELEAAYVTGWADNASLIPGVDMDTLTFNQWGGVLQAEWQPAAALPLTVQLESGVASGDRAWGMGAYPSLDQLTTEAGDLNGPQFHLPGDTGIDNFRFHPNFHVDRILWRRLVGTFTDGLFVKGRARWFPLEALRVDASVIYSRALYAESTPGLARPLGVEAMLDLTWYWRHGLEITADYAFLYPLAGFRDAFAGVDPSPAHAAELHLGVRF